MKIESGKDAVIVNFPYNLITLLKLKLLRDINGILMEKLERL